jgi:hypothetical protein
MISSNKGKIFLFLMGADECFLRSNYSKKQTMLDYLCFEQRFFINIEKFYSAKIL